MTNGSQNPTLQNKADLIKAKINDAIQYSTHTKNVNRRRAATIKIVTIVLSGIATMLLGLQIAGYEKYMKDVAFVLTAVVTLSTALEPYFNYRALWVENEIAQARFYRLKDQLEFDLAGVSPDNLDEDYLSTIFAKYQDAWNELSDAWIRYRKQETQHGK